jgi:hypothetical protein
LRHGEPQRLRCFDVDGQLIFGRPLHWQVGRFLPFEDAIDIAGCTSVLVDRIRTIGGALLDFLYSDFSFTVQEKAEIRVFCEAITATPEEIVGPFFQYMERLGPRLNFGRERAAI